MTGENRRDNANEELSRVEICLNEARALHAAAFPYGAVSRAYYAVFHASRALLFSIGLEAKSHKAVVSMIGDHFVRPGRLSPQMGRLLSRLLPGGPGAKPHQSRNPTNIPGGVLA